MNVTRGVGAIPLSPLCTVGEENVLCYRDTTFQNEDLTLRQVALGLLYLAARYVNPEYYRRIQHAYTKAQDGGRWQNTYASLSAEAYFVSREYWNILYLIIKL